MIWSKFRSNRVSFDFLFSFIFLLGFSIDENIEIIYITEIFRVLWAVSGIDSHLLIQYFLLDTPHRWRARIYRVLSLSKILIRTHRATTVDFLSVCHMVVCAQKRACKCVRYCGADGCSIYLYVTCCCMCYRMSPSLCVYCSQYVNVSVFSAVDVWTGWKNRNKAHAQRQ